MNERIRELALKAAESSNWKPGLGNEHVQEYFQAFAELIVKKCVEVIDAQTPVWENTNVPAEFALDHATRNVKAYFGVEE